MSDPKVSQPGNSDTEAGESIAKPYQFVTKEEIEAVGNGVHLLPNHRIERLYRFAERLLAERDAALEVAASLHDLTATGYPVLSEHKVRDAVARLLSGKKDTKGGDHAEV